MKTDALTVERLRQLDKAYKTNGPNWLQVQMEYEQALWDHRAEILSALSDAERLRQVKALMPWIEREARCHDIECEQATALLKALLDILSAETEKPGETR